MSLKEFLILAFGVIGLLWYFFCLFNIGFKPLNQGQRPDGFRQFMSLSITAIGVSLATFVGMLLGVQGVSQEFEKSVKPLAHGLSNLQFEAAKKTEFVTSLQEALEKIEWTTSLQWAAASLYLLSLLMAIGFWGWKRESTDPAVSNLAKSLLGLCGGALAIILNLPS